VLAERAREEAWSYERFAEILLGTEVSARDSHGGEGRIKTARFPARKTLEEFDFTFQRSVKKTVIEHLGQLDFLHGKENVILLGPPAPAKHTSRPLSASGRAWPVNECCSQPRHSGSPASAKPNAKANSKPSCAACRSFR